jgi:hypothetical protein
LRDANADDPINRDSDAEQYSNPYGYEYGDDDASIAHGDSYQEGAGATVHRRCRQ